MKKTIIAILAAAAMVACSNDEFVKVADKEAIAFDKAFVNNSTRSVYDPSWTNTNLTGSFAVYGSVKGENTDYATLFNNKEVTGSGTTTAGNASWSYAGTQYWITGASYKFAAVLPYACAADGAYDRETNLTALTFINDGETDLLYATAKVDNVAEGYNTPVAFTFRHTLSKVKFSFKNAYNADNTLLRVHSITVNNAVETADVVLSPTTTTWHPTVAVTGMTLNFGNAATTAVNALETFGYNTEVESYNQLLLIPAEYKEETAKLNVTFKYDVVVGGVTINTFTVNPKVAVNLEPGHAYDFKATIEPGQPIVFTVTSVDGWDTTNEAQTM